MDALLTDHWLQSDIGQQRLYQFFRACNIKAENRLAAMEWFAQGGPVLTSAQLDEAIHQWQELGR